MEERRRNVAYFTPEIAIHQDLHTYVGGLGVVAGGMAYSAHRLNFPLVIVSILWRQGYYEQETDEYGMKVSFNDYFYEDLLEDTGVTVCVRVHTNPAVAVKVWRLPPGRFGACPVYFLDTDTEGNDELARSITRNLYHPDEGRRLATEIVLGIGGVRALRALGFRPESWHLNEGHSVLAGIELLREKMAEEGTGFDEGLRAVKDQVVFTTHTPELAGNEEHHVDEMMRFGCFQGLSRKEAVFLGGGGDIFNMTACGLKISRLTNAVSRLHSETANRMWSGVEGRAPIIEVLNGVDREFWQEKEFKEAQTPQALREAKRKYKRRMLEYAEIHSGKLFEEDIFTIVWARRFAEYKRADLFFNDEGEWIEALLWSKEIQVIYAGKPHYQDQDMIDVWGKLRRKSFHLPGFAILPGYELGLSKILKAGADLWVHTHRRPQGACETSWMSALLNGARVCSTKDGGPLEGPKEVFLYGVDHAFPDRAEQDWLDFCSLKETIEMAADKFYHAPDEWYREALEAKWFAEKFLTSDRMLRDYVEKMYRLS